MEQSYFKITTDVSICRVHVNKYVPIRKINYDNMLNSSQASETERQRERAVTHLPKKKN